jgi:hypothetical protein
VISGLRGTTSSKMKRVTSPAWRTPSGISVLLLLSRRTRPPTSVSQISAPRVARTSSRRRVVLKRLAST